MSTKIQAKDYDGHWWTIDIVTRCEHCGPVRKQYGTVSSTSFCAVCSDANGIDVAAVRRAIKGKRREVPND